MGWFKKVFRKSKGKKSSDHSSEKEGQNDASDHGNKPEPKGDHRQPNDPEENTNRVSPTSPDREPPPHRAYEPDYQPWSIYGPGGWRPAGYHQQEDYHRGGYPVYGGEASEQRDWGSFSHATQYTGHGNWSSGRYTGYDHFAGSSVQVNNYWSPPRMLDYDTWNRGQYVKSDHDVWTSDYWQGLFQPPHGGWS